MFKEWVGRSEFFFGGGNVQGEWVGKLDFFKCEIQYLGCKNNILGLISLFTLNLNIFLKMTCKNIHFHLSLQNDTLPFQLYLNYQSFAYRLATKKIIFYGKCLRKDYFFIYEPWLFHNS